MNTIGLNYVNHCTTTDFRIILYVSVMANNKPMSLLVKSFALASHALIGEVGAWIAVGITYDTRAHGSYACSLLIN